MKKNPTSRKQLIHRLFQVVLHMMMLVSIFNVIGNVAYGFPMTVNVKWIIFFILTGVTYYYTREKLEVHFKFMYFSVIIFALLPVGFLDSGGSSNNTIGYIFLVVICITFFFWGWQRIFLVISTILVFNGLLIVEDLYPELVSKYASESQDLDRLAQMTLLLLLTFFFLKAFSDAYAKDKQKLDQLVYYDSLTGLLNRRSFDTYLESWIENQGREYRYLLFFDIDNFKGYNDTRGHRYGDDIIRQTGQRLKENFADRGLVARWGGDEFAVLYKGDKKSLIEKTENVLFDTQFTLSCGICKYEKGISEQKILNRADEALYEAKDKGKNQWVLKEKT